MPPELSKVWEIGFHSLWSRGCTSFTPIHVDASYFRLPSRLPIGNQQCWGQKGRCAFDTRPCQPVNQKVRGSTHKNGLPSSSQYQQMRPRGYKLGQWRNLTQREFSLSISIFSEFFTLSLYYLIISRNHRDNNRQTLDTNESSTCI